jgi:hypothetical protein
MRLCLADMYEAWNVQGLRGGQTPTASFDRRGNQSEAFRVDR